MDSKFDFNDINSLTYSITSNYYNKIEEENKRLVGENKRLVEENEIIKKKLRYYDVTMARNRNRARCRILIKNGLISKSRFKKVSGKIKRASNEEKCLHILKKEIEKEWKDHIEQPLPLEYREDITFTQIKTRWTEKIKGWKNTQNK